MWKKTSAQAYGEMSFSMNVAPYFSRKVPFADRGTPGKVHRHKLGCRSRAAPAKAAEAVADALKVSFVSLGCPKNVVDGKKDAHS